jgi:putative transcriptional regulator
MPKQKKKQKHRIEAVQPGCVLIAQPFWQDEVFKRAVILVVEMYNDEDDEGQLKYKGIIINKESTVVIEDALPVLRGNKGKMYFGGNLFGRMIHYIHRIPEIPEANDLGNGILYGGDPAALEEMVLEDKIDFNKIRFCAGYIEWTEEKLKAELDAERWWIQNITADELFMVPETLWSFKLLKAGITYGLFAHIPDPTLEERAGKDVKID